MTVAVTVSIFALLEKPRMETFFFVLRTKLLKLNITD